MHLNREIKITLILSILLSISKVSQCKVKFIEFFEHAYFLGDKGYLNMKSGVCYNMGSFNDRISSINLWLEVDVCLYVFQHSNCNFKNGRYLKLTDKSDCLYNLGLCGYDFNDRISSLLLC